MAQKVFKGFMQVTEGNFEAQNGYIYFVRNSANTGHTDGYIQFNGKKYGTAAELEADVNAKIGTLPEGYDNLVDYIDGQLSAVTDNFSSDSVTGSSNGVEVEIGQADGNVTAVTVTAPDFANTYAPIGVTSADTRLNVLETSAATKTEVGTLSGRVDAIEADYLTSSDKTALEGAIGAESARTDALEAISAGTRISALESISADTRLETLEDDFAALSGETRLSALEDSAHTHSNKAVLDTIDQNKVDAWDSMAGGANVVLSAYTSGEGLTDGMLKSYEIFQGGVSKGKIDIPKDMVVTSGVITANTNDEKVLRLTIANQSEPVDILVSDLVDVYTAGDGIEISNSNEVSAKVVEANGLSVDSNGIAVSLADANSAGTMSAADFVKLGTIDASAQTNVIEEVKVDGTALTVTNKSVNIDLSGKVDNSTFGTLSGRVDALEAVSAGTRLGTIEAISADTRLGTLEAISADTRLDALEELSGETHTHDNKGLLDSIDDTAVNSWDDAADKAHEHDNKSVLDGISAEDVAAWDDAEQNAKDYADGLKNGLNADVSGDSNGVEVRVQQVSGVVTDVTVTAPDFANTYAPISLTGVTSADTRLNVLETSAATKTEVGTLSGRVDTLEAISADTRLQALEAISGDTASALQSVSAGDASVSVGNKDANNDQTVAVAISTASGNTLSLENDGLFAAIYYDGDDSGN